MKTNYHLLDSRFWAAAGILLLAGAACKAAVPVILNEYNAVSSANVLRNGNSDIYWGIVPGNGGDWFEVAVAGDGTPGSFVDMRGWTFLIEDGVNDGDPANDDASDFVLTGHKYWSAVPAGTILTFIEDTTEMGGLDTQLHVINRLASEGWAWSNICLQDPLFTVITDAEPNAEGRFFTMRVSNDNTQITIMDAEGNVVFGPAGEGVNPLSGVNSEEVFKLEADPTPYLTPGTANYNDGSSSTFGRPNLWSGGTGIQSFTPFIFTPAAPVIETPPAGLTVTEGGPVVFAVEASGTPPLFYTWSKDGAGIPGADGPELAFQYAQEADAGSYTVTVSNIAGTAESAPAVLTVNPAPDPPEIIEHPRDVSVSEGEDAAFDVTASGAGPLIYQWSKDGEDIPGAAAASLILENTGMADAGFYAVTVTNAHGSAVSASAELSVRPSIETRLTGYFGEAAGAGNGWFEISWFGYVEASLFPWFWHAQLGWLYAAGEGGQSCWLWTKPDTFPFLYSADTSGWLFFYRGSGNGKGGAWFYDYATRENRWVP